MAPKRSSKQASGLSQPTLSFQAKRPTTGGGKAVNKNLSKTPALRKSGSASSLSSVDRAATPPVKEVAEVIEVPEEVRDTLDPNGKEWNALYKDARTEMGNMPAIHAGPEMTKVHNILRVFDLTSKYGPCAGITRLERWERAKKWGLNPPDEVKTILLTEQGEDDASLRESVLHGWV